MATLAFSDKPILSTDTDTWPRSPDRDKDGVGRDAYKSDILQGALKSTPKNQSLLSSYSNILNNCGPQTFNGVVFYSKDPVPDLMNEVSGKDIYFSDDSFPSHLWYDTANGQGVDNYKRVKDKITTPKMFGNTGPLITDMYQVGLGDCQFISNIGSVLLNPQGHNLIFSSIYPSVYNPVGIYSVRVRHGFSNYYLLIDDLLPDEGYSFMNNDEFWYFLIEKAFAKIRGGYVHLTAVAYDYFGLSLLPDTDNINSDPTTFWSDKLLPSFQLFKRTGEVGTSMAPKYLQPDHDYAVLDAAEWGDVKLVRLHNPWGVADYTGPYAPNSTDWNTIPESVRESVFQNSRFDNKTFWIPYDIFCAEFNVMNIYYLVRNLPDGLSEICNGYSIQDAPPLSVNLTAHFDHTNNMVNVDTGVFNQFIDGSMPQSIAYVLDVNCPSLVNNGPENISVDASMPADISLSTTFDLYSVKDAKGHSYPLKMMAMNGDYKMNSIAGKVLSDSVLKLKIDDNSFNSLPPNSTYTGVIPLNLYFRRLNKFYKLNVNVSIAS